MSETATTPQEQPLWQQRPAGVQALIDACFQQFVDHGPPTVYSKLGTSNTYHWRTAKMANALLLINRLSRELGRPLEVLDIGTGFGHFVGGLLSNGHRGIGISANDYRELDSHYPRIPDDNYRVGDAHSLHDLLELDQDFDLVTTRWTLRHLVDPLAVLEDAANRVRANGILAHDAFRWDPYVHRNVGFGIIREAMYAGGFVEIDSAAPRRMIERDVYASAPDCIWRRADNNRAVRFPVEYDTYGFDPETKPGFRYARMEQ